MTSHALTESLWFEALGCARRMSQCQLTLWWLKPAVSLANVKDDTFFFFKKEEVGYCAHAWKVRIILLFGSSPAQTAKRWQTNATGLFAFPFPWITPRPLDRVEDATQASHSLSQSICLAKVGLCIKLQVRWSEKQVAVCLPRRTHWTQGCRGKNF